MPRVLSITLAFISHPIPLSHTTSHWTSLPPTLFRTTPSPHPFSTRNHHTIETITLIDKPLYRPQHHQYLPAPQPACDYRSLFFLSMHKSRFERVFQNENLRSDSSNLNPRLIFSGLGTPSPVYRARSIPENYWPCRKTSLLRVTTTW